MTPQKNLIFNRNIHAGGSANIDQGPEGIGNPPGNGSQKKFSTVQTNSHSQFLGQERTHSSKKGVTMSNAVRVRYTPPGSARAGKQVSTSKQHRPSPSPQSDESDDDSSTTDDEDNSEEISQVSSQVSTNDDRQRYKQRFHLMKSKYLETVQELQDLKESYERSVQTVKFKTIELASRALPFEQATYNRVEHFARNQVFRRHKFFTKAEEVNDFTVKGSAGDMVMTAFKVDSEMRPQWWNNYKMAVEEGVNYSRHGSQTLIGKEIKSTL